MCPKRTLNVSVCPCDLRFAVSFVSTGATAMILFSCPECGSELEFGDEAAGTSVRCPECRDRLTVPAMDTDPLLPAAITTETAQPPRRRTTCLLAGAALALGLMSVVAGVVFWERLQAWLFPLPPPTIEIQGWYTTERLASGAFRCIDRKLETRPEGEILMVMECKFPTAPINVLKRSLRT